MQPSSCPLDNFLKGLGINPNDVAEIRSRLVASSISSVEQLVLISSSRADEAAKEAAVEKFLSKASKGYLDDKPAIEALIVSGILKLDKDSSGGVSLGSPPSVTHAAARAVPNAPGGVQARVDDFFGKKQKSFIQRHKNMSLFVGCLTSKIIK
jgi:hypothetical protein